MRTGAAVSVLPREGKAGAQGLLSATLGNNLSYNDRSDLVTLFTVAYWKTIIAG